MKYLRKQFIDGHPQSIDGRLRKKIGIWVYTICRWKNWTNKLMIVMLTKTILCNFLEKYYGYFVHLDGHSTKQRISISTLQLGILLSCQAFLAICQTRK
jgi:hypothetical protein